MVLEEFFIEDDDGRIVITAEQASRFAKEMAGDFNPIHNPGARRFCVPGDLLFSLVLARFGLSPCMTFYFRGMVGDSVPLTFEQSGETITVSDARGKVYLHVDRSGEPTFDPTVISAFTRRYIAFSGRNFPHYLQPLMQEHGVMFNPERPLVIYDSMGFCLNRLDAEAPTLHFDKAWLDVAGKRADAHMHFEMIAGDERIGTGEKKLVVSGLQPYCDETMQGIICDFNKLKAAATA
ncbi:DUF3581 family protein [Larsenimonas salina]|uniref:DUF3581 family protein n=1 Tax=Larsenimonas salina TaxID=1295565 RepID=UPI0020737EAA|nr:DUF3581 family protein [Larsenimonas salina]MCM5705169.1 DUF3581 domain-containing protein [Larsenimonas salina]